MNVNVKQGTNLEDVQEMNRSLIVKMLRKKQICSRAELAQASGLNQSTITNIVNELINWGLIIETGMIDGKKGRRSIGIKLNSLHFKIVGVRLTRKSISVGLYDLEGQEYDFKKISINTVDGSETAFKRMKEMIAETIEKSEAGKVYAIGLATPGPLFRNEGRIALMTFFPGWEKINIQKELALEYNLPVYVEHDAKAGALAHWWFGDYQPDHGIMIYVAAGQGIGAGIVIDGTVYRGALGMAGEIGHMTIDYQGPRCECGNEGCLELYASSSALLNMMGKDHTSLKAIWKALQEGDPQIEEMVRKAAWFLGIGIVNIVNVYNPDRIILGDEMAEAGDLLLTTIIEVVKAKVLPDVWCRLTIELAPPDKDFMLMGAATIAIDSLLNQPSTYLRNAQT